MTQEQRDNYEAIKSENFFNMYCCDNEDVIELMHSVYMSRQAEIEALQAKITEYAALLMDYEEKFDVIAENEAVRMIEFGGKVLKAAESWVTQGTPLKIIKRDILEIDLKQLYTNYKRK